MDKIPVVKKDPNGKTLIQKQFVSLSKREVKLYIFFWQF
jgi:hypothetical protein